MKPAQVKGASCVICDLFLSTSNFCLQLREFGETEKCQRGWGEGERNCEQLNKKLRNNTNFFKTHILHLQAACGEKCPCPLGLIFNGNYE